jgi:hypothetical protein
MTDGELRKWASYYHFLYFKEDMTFVEFIEKVKTGNTPRRQVIDWKKVRPVYEIHIEMGESA